MKTYIVYVAFAAFHGDYSLNFVDEDDLSKIIEAYKNGEKEITLSGKTRGFLNPKNIQIYEVLKKDALTKVLKAKGTFFKEQGLLKLKNGNLILKQKLLDGIPLVTNVTKDLIGNLAYGEMKAESSEKADYVSKARIKELQSISNSSFDLTKVVQFCKEINDNWARENYISVAALVRALKDHVPPIFGANNFNEVANNYSGAGRSFSSSMKTLQNSLKDISDRLIHSHISNRVTLPSDAQVNFSQDLDVLLEEMSRILK